MREIYVDSEFKCHTFNDGTMTVAKTDFFDDKCATFVEGYCYETRENGVAIYPWKSSTELVAAQSQYELMMAEAAAAYWEGVNSV